MTINNERPITIEQLMNGRNGDKVKEALQIAVLEAIGMPDCCKPECSGLAKLALCPFCGNREQVPFVSLYSFVDDQYFFCVKCDYCGSIGPLVCDEHPQESVRSAVDNWNKRAEVADGA